MTDESKSVVQITTTDIPSPVVIIEAEALERMSGLIRRANMILVTDVETFQRADGVNREIRGFLREIETHRSKIKAPVLDLGRKIDKVAREAMAPLREATDELSKRILAFQREQERIAREEREAKERAEREAEEARREALQAALKGNQEEAREILETLVEAETTKAVAAPAPEPVKSKSITTRKRKVFEVVDLAKIPRRVSIQEGGTHYEVNLWVPDLKRCEELLRKGYHIPGCELRDSESIASRA